MSNYIIKYGRGERVKYISHLDFMRMMQRAVRRSGIEMEFSQGFNPHPQMTVAMPLSVGVTSECEYMKIGMRDGYTEEEIKKGLNDALPEGFSVFEVKKTESGKAELAALDRAEYIAKIETNYGKKPDIAAFLANKELNVMKKSKSGTKEENIRPHIFGMDIQSYDGDILTVSMLLSAGNLYNLKPDTVIDAMEKYIEGFRAEFFTLHRKAVFSGEN